MPSLVLSETPRRAVLEDMEAVARLHRLAFFHAMPWMPVLHTPEEDLNFYYSAVFANCEIWLTEQAGMITGFVAFRRGWVDHLYIHPACQRRGLGRALLAIAQTASDALRLWTFQHNASARRFYAAHGFRIERETDGADNEERQPDILYFWSRETKSCAPQLDKPYWL